MKKQGIWISFDLESGADYPNLYKWLDLQKAKECGPNVAYFNYTYDVNVLDELTADLTRHVDFKTDDRVYVIRRVDDNPHADHTTPVSGKFIIGSRNPTPWEGCAQTEDINQDNNE